MVPTQELIKARQYATGNISQYISMWKCMGNHIAFIPPSSIFFKWRRFLRK